MKPSSRRYLLTWIEHKPGRSARVYYEGWWQFYNEPLYGRDIKNAKRMSYSGARAAKKRLADPKRWGSTDATLVLVTL